MGVNKAILVGRLGADPELRTTQSGKSVATVSIATTKKWRDAEGQQKEQTQWHRLVLWGALADVISEYGHKGSQVYVEGEIIYRSYEDKEGVTKYVTEINVRNLQLLGSGDPKKKNDDQPPKRRDDDDLPF